VNDNAPVPARVTPEDLTEWLRAGWATMREAPLYGVWIAIAAIVPVAALARFLPPVGWMAALVVAPVFQAGAFRYEALKRVDLPVTWSTVFDPWYAPAVRRGLLTLGGFLAVAGVVAVGIELSIVGGGAVMLSRTADGGDPGWFLAVLVVGVGAVAAALVFVGFVFAVPLIASRPCGPLDAIAASAAACRRNPLVAASLAALTIAMVLLAPPTLGLSLLVGFPVFAFALAEGTRAVFPEP